MTTPEPDKNLTDEQERVEAMWSPGLGVIVVRNTASGDKVEFGEEAWQAFLDGHRGISGESGRRLAALRDLHAPYGIYDELDHFHDPYEDQWPDGHDRVNAGDFTTCAAMLMYEICRYCCTSGEDYGQTEECVSEHKHGPGQPLCPTRVIIEGGEIGE